MNTEQLIFDKGNETACGFVGYGPNGGSYLSHGLTKREYFAAMALQGMYSNPELVNQWDCEDIMALNAVRAADALIKQLNS